MGEHLEVFGFVALVIGLALIWLERRLLFFKWLTHRGQSSDEFVSRAANESDWDNAVRWNAAASKRKRPSRKRRKPGLPYWAHEVRLWAGLFSALAGAVVYALQAYSDLASLFAHGSIH